MKIRINYILKGVFVALAGVSLYGAQSIADQAHTNQMHIESLLGMGHIILAITALAVGAAMFLQKKGGAWHRKFGYLYSVSLLLVNVSALLLYQDTGSPGPFHIFALISLITLIAGVYPAFLRKPKNVWIHRHAYFMSWSFVGLVAAGVGQMATKISGLPGIIAVGLPSVVIALAGGILIHNLVPQILSGFTRTEVTT